MTVRKGEEWGTQVSRPPNLVSAATDAELARLVDADPGGAFGLSGGDLYRSLGSPPSRAVMQLLPMDALHVRVDDEDELLAVAHVVARDGWWRGPLLGALNCAYVDTWNVAPRAHPNDGHFDIVEVSRAMSVRQRWQARRRLPLGTHLPHPAIAVRTAESSAWTFEPSRDIYVDGVRRGRASRLAITIAPDHFSIHT